MGGMVLSTVVLLAAAAAQGAEQKPTRESTVVKTSGKANSVSGTNSAALTNRPAGKGKVGPVFRDLPKVPAERAGTNSYQAPKGRRDKAAP